MEARNIPEQPTENVEAENSETDGATALHAMLNLLKPQAADTKNPDNPQPPENPDNVEKI